MDITEKQKRIEEAENFFNQLYGKIIALHFSYLITFKDRIETYSFEINNETGRRNMAIKAIELADNGVDVWHAVNTISVKPANGKRGDENVVSFQTAIIVDIDIRSDAHKGDPALFAADFDKAKSFLPFTPSLIIHSGYGLHAYYIFNTPITITDQNREEIKRRNNLLLDVVRTRANGKKIDGVGDLPRILRTPGTFNFKLGKDNAPLCHIVEDSGLRFTPDEIDEKLNNLISITPSQEILTKSARKNFNDYDDDNPDLKEFRIRRMLDYINVVDGEYEKWLGVGFALFNEGMDCSIWEQWSRTQPDFKEGECERKWNGFHHDSSGITIGSLYQWATEGGYNEKEIRNEWHELNPETSEKKKSAVSSIDSLKVEFRSVNKALAEFDSQKSSALEKLRKVEIFDSDTVFSEEMITAAAFAKIFDKQAFSNFKRDIINYGNQHKDKKVSANDWLSDVKDKAAEIRSHQSDLLTRRNEIQSEIHSLSFIANNDFLKGFSFPTGYSVTNNGGVIRIEGEKIISVCRRPVIIKAKTYNVEDKIFKLELAYQTTTGKWKNLTPTEAAIIFNRNKLVDLANDGLPVTSSNATAFVDYLDAFNAENEDNFPLTYTVPRCGWYKFDGKDCFVDPRRQLSVTDDNKNISVVVDSLSQFANSLRKVGKLEDWKKIYLLAKKSPVARIMISAAIAPILLKILGERNFLLYICAPTRAGKTTALYLAASTIGDEKMIRSFDATKNGLAGAAADVNDYAFLVDEKQVADNRIKEQLDALVYALANGVGRTKLNKDSTLRKLKDWRTIAIMTGETQLLADNVTGGANTRLLTIVAPKEILSADTCKEIRNAIKGNYGLVFPLVINKIFELGFEKLRQVYQDLTDLFTTKYPELLNEYCRYMAVLTLADALLNATLTDNSALPIDDAIQNSNAIFKLIPTTTEISDTAREKVFILGFIAQNQNRFIGGNVAVDKIQMIFGKFDTDYIYITVAALKKACADEGFDYRKLVSDLVEDGFFVPSDKIKKGYRTPLATVQKKIGKANTDCYRIKRTIFDGDE